MNDAWDVTNWDGLCGTPWLMVAPQLILTKKVTFEEKGAGTPLPWIVAERIPEVEPRRFYPRDSRKLRCASHRWQ